MDTDMAGKVAVMTQAPRTKPDDYWKTESFVRKYVRNSILGRKDNKAMTMYESAVCLSIVQGIYYLVGDTPKAILDMGCGHAVRTAQMKANFGCRVVGADYSVPFLDQAKNIQQHMPMNHRVELVKADVYDLPFGDAEFDVAICYGLYMSLSEPERSDLLRTVRYGLVMIEETDAVMTPDQRIEWLKVKNHVFPGRIYWHDYLKLFGLQKSVMFSPLPVPSSWDTGTPPGYARIIVVKEQRDAAI